MQINTCRFSPRDATVAAHPRPRGSGPFRLDVDVRTQPSTCDHADCTHLVPHSSPVGPESTTDWSAKKKKKMMMMMMKWLLVLRRSSLTHI